MDGLEKPEQHVLGIHTERRSGGLGMPKGFLGRSCPSGLRSSLGNAEGAEGLWGEGRGGVKVTWGYSELVLHWA